MKSLKVRLLALLAVVMMLLTVSGPAMADSCEFVGFDEFGDALFLCEVDVDDDFFFAEFGEDEFVCDSPTDFDGHPANCFDDDGDGFA